MLHTTEHLAAMKKRLMRLLILILLVGLSGVSYGLFVKITGIAVPCVFRLVTGLQCPGCGVTHMCMALLQLDIQEAYNSHPMLFIQLPILAVIAVKNAIVYIRQGSYRLSKAETVVIYVCIALLLIFTVYRNLIER